MKHSISGLPTALFALVLGVAASAPASAEPRCTVLQFLDAKGVLMSTPTPIIGLLIGDKPVYEESMPAAASIRAGAEAPCPATLVAGIRATFDASCVSEQRRNQAAVDHKVDRKVVDKGCTDIIKALGAAAVAPK